MVFKKIIFQNRYVALETPSRPPAPLHGKYHLKFPFWLSAPLPYHQTNKYLKLLQSSPSPLTLWGLERIELNLLQIFLTSSRYSHKTSVAGFGPELFSFRRYFPAAAENCNFHICVIYFQFSSWTKYCRLIFSMFRSFWEDTGCSL